MTDFNDLPLSEQLKALQVGDELHLRGGGWLPFVEWVDGYIGSHEKCGLWYDTGNYTNEPNAIDIIRVVRPVERKVPEIVEKLREFGLRERHSLGATRLDMNTPVGVLAFILADHFEKEIA